MLNTKIRTTETLRIISITCDCCKKEFSGIWDTQEFLCIDDIGGFYSAIGDGTRYQCDLCSACVKKLLGKYLRFPDF